MTTPNIPRLYGTIVSAHMIFIGSNKDNLDCWQDFIIKITLKDATFQNSIGQAASNILNTLTSCNIMQKYIGGGQRDIKKIQDFSVSHKKQCLTKTWRNIKNKWFQ